MTRRGKQIGLTGQWHGDELAVTRQVVHVFPFAIAWADGFSLLPNSRLPSSHGLAARLLAYLRRRRGYSQYLYSDIFLGGSFPME